MGMVSEPVKPVHKWKAFSPMLVTVLGMVSDHINLQEANVSLPIAVMELGKVRLPLKPEHK